MEQLKTQILQEFENYWAKEDKLIQDNAQYLDKNTYSDEFIKNKQAEIERSKKSQREMIIKKFEMLEKKFIEGLKVDTKTIDSLEYQTKLSNTLKLMELNNGSISRDNLEFLIKARDYNTLKTLSLKYNTMALKQAAEESNIEVLKYQAQELIYNAKLNLYDFMGKPRNRSEVRSMFR